MKKIIVAIDGYSSTGKSTMAKVLAKEVGYRYIDTGAMYRAVTLYAMEHGLISPAGEVNADALADLLGDIDIEFAIQPDGSQHTMLNGQDVENRIRQMDVSANVSAVAAIPAVRHDLVAKQQAYGREKGIVMDGRDIATTVFPSAEMKVFVTASAETRAERRLAELLAKGEHTTFEEVLANVVHRDHIDTTRKESPLRQAPDALLLDNSTLSREEQNHWLLHQFKLHTC